MSVITVGQAKSPLVLALDLGTSSTRALVFDAAGRTVSDLAVQIPYEIETSPDGRAEDGPERLWTRVASCLDRVLAAAGNRAGDIVAVCAASLASSLLAVDASGQPLTPIYLYSDTRCAPQAAELRARLDENAVHQRTGCLLRSAYAPARLLWLRQTAPEVWDRAWRWVSLSEFLYLRLFGQANACYSIASWSGLLDRQHLTWDSQLLAAIGLSAERLNPLADVDRSIRDLKPEWARRWPPLAHIPWFPAIGDGAGANLGSGCGIPGHVALTVGTTGAMRVVVEEAVTVPTGLWAYRVNRRLSLLGGATSEGGNVMAWLRRTLQLPDPAAVEAYLQTAEPDRHGLTVLPFLAGERSPGWRDDARAVITGLDQATTPLDIAQAALEAVAYRFALIARLLQPWIGGDVIASGGALLHSPAWRQIMADVLGRTILPSAEPEPTARGAALLALTALGTISSPDTLPPALGTPVTPRPAYHPRYQEAVRRQEELYRRTGGSEGVAHLA